MSTRNGALGCDAAGVDAVSNASDDRGSSSDGLRANARCVNGCSSRSSAGCDADPAGDARGEDVPEDPCGLSGELRGRGDDGGDPRGCTRDGSVEREMGDAATTVRFSAVGDAVTGRGSLISSNLHLNRTHDGGLGRDDRCG
jgi:hypothetical protein